MKTLEQGKVSIITPVYNAEEFLSETIESVLAQTYENWELILVDDCSKDESAKIIQEYSTRDSRVKYFKLSENSGAAVARNFGLDKALGRYIAFIDSDDLWVPEKLKKQLKFMKKNSYGFTFTSYDIINENSEVQNKVRKSAPEVDYNFLLKNIVIGCASVVIDREIIGDVRMPLMRTRQDNSTWLQILREGNKAYGIDEVLMLYRVTPNSISANKIKAAKQVWYSYRAIERLNIFKTMYYFSFYAFNAVKKRA